jgi:predicted aspartyl protease
MAFGVGRVHFLLQKNIKESFCFRQKIQQRAQKLQIILNIIVAESFQFPLQVGQKSVLLQ